MYQQIWQQQLAVINIVGTVMRLFVGFAADKTGTKILFSIALIIQCILFGFYHY